MSGRDRSNAMGINRQQVRDEQMGVLGLVEQNLAGLTDHLQGL